MFLIIIMYMLFASTFTIGKAALQVVDPLFFIGFRMVLGGLLLLIFEAIRDFNRLTINKSHGKYFLLLAIIHIYLAYTLEFWSLQYVSSAKACLMYNLSPFLTSLCLYVLYGETLSYKKILGLIIGCIGFIPILEEFTPQELSFRMFSSLSLPEGALLLSVFSSVCGWILFRYMMKEYLYHPTIINGYTMVIGGIMSLGTSFLIEGTPVIGISSSISEIGVFLGYALLMVLVANILGYNLYGYLLKRYNPTLLSFFGFITPLFASFFGYILLSEPITPGFIYSLSIVSLGLYIFYQEDLSQ